MVTHSLSLDSYFRLSPGARKLMEKELTRDPDAPVGIAEAALIAGCSQATLRRMEREGKIGKIRRNRRGYRLYTNDDLFRILNLSNAAA